MKVSVALCSFNGEKYIAEQLESILAQSVPVDEIVITDDCSSDNTCSIIEKFITKYPSLIRLEKNSPTLGVIKNFEKAIGLCTGDIIFLSDQDDVWLEHKVAAIVEKFEAQPNLAVVFSNGIMIDNNGLPMKETLFEKFGFNEEAQSKWSSPLALSDILYTRNYITGATMALKPALMQKAYPFSCIRALWHDGWLGVHAAANGALGWLNEPLIKYRIHASQQIGIGNGVAMSRNGDKGSLRNFLLDLRKYNLDCLSLISRITDQYPEMKKYNFQQEGLDWLAFIDVRLSLPKSFPSRLYVIVKNMGLYKALSISPLRSIFRDLLKPAIS